MKDFIKKTLKENYDVHQNLEGVTTDILKAVVRELVKSTIHHKNALNVFNRIDSVFSKLPNRYLNLQGFLNDFDLSFKFTKNLGDKTQGKFRADSEDSGTLYINYPPQEINRILTQYVLNKVNQPITSDDFNQMVEQVYDSIVNESMYTTTLHELQHAFDSWRSGGLYMSNKSTSNYHNKYGDNTGVSDEQYREYLNLQHEINARFTEALRKIVFTKENNGDFKNKPDGHILLAKFDSVKSQFMNHFHGFGELTDKSKKRLFTRLAKAYQNRKEWAVQQNKKSPEMALNENHMLYEDATGKHLIVVDVQPEYSNWMHSLPRELFGYINMYHDSLYNLTFLYNGEDTLGMISEGDYREWLVDSGLDEEIAYEARLYDKGYAFFRNCMDKSADEENLVNLVKFMREHNINDSRELTEEFWTSFVEQYGSEDIQELMQDSDDSINIPDLMDFLEPFNNIVLVGGGINECLKEVELALDALDKNYTTWHKFTY